MAFRSWPMKNIEWPSWRFRIELNNSTIHFCVCRENTQEQDHCHVKPYLLSIPFLTDNNQHRCRESMDTLPFQYRLIVPAFYPAIHLNETKKLSNARLSPF